MDLLYPLLLAQTAKAAENGLTMLERIQAGGIPLICLVVAAICGVAFYWQLRANQAIRQAQVKQADAREEAAKNEAAARLVEQEKLLREMLERDREAQEAHIAATQAVEGFTLALRDASRQLEELLRLVRIQSERMDDIERTLRRRSDAGPQA